VQPECHGIELQSQPLFSLIKETLSRASGGGGINTPKMVSGDAIHTVEILNSLLEEAV
jgi:hypothetical protein